jgi:hypothetical protein
MENRCDTPERLMQYALEGRLTKHALATLLTPQPRRVFLEACAAIENRYTDECKVADDPCLEAGCSMEEGEICLQPLLRAGTEYHKACGSEWVTLFTDSKNRASAWSIGVSRAPDV